MICGKRVAVVLPAYNAARTLAATIGEIPPGVADALILVDDGSTDDTVEVARGLGLEPIVHPENRGYGGNQKTCYDRALALGAEVVVMLHPDHQYSPQLVGAMAAMVAGGKYDVALGSRFIGERPLAGGMPLYKYLANRALTEVENRLLGARLSEFHTGYRAWSRRALESLPWRRNSDGFLFDNQILAQAIGAGLPIGELSCPARYFPEASSIGFARGVEYSLGVLGVAGACWLHRRGIRRAGVLEGIAPVA